MSNKSSESSRKTKTIAAASKPLDAGVLRRAREIVRGYRLVIQPSDRLGYIGHTVEVPTVFADGASPERCVKAVMQAQAGYVAMLLESGETPPSPVSDARREAQINIRVTAEEKMIFEEGARRGGFRNVSEFIRTSTLAQLASRSSHVRSGKRAG